MSSSFQVLSNPKPPVVSSDDKLPTHGFYQYALSRDVSSHVRVHEAWASTLTLPLTPAKKAEFLASILSVLGARFSEFYVYRVIKAEQGYQVIFANVQHIPYEPDAVVVKHAELMQADTQRLKRFFDSPCLGILPVHWQFGYIDAKHEDKHEKRHMEKLLLRLKERAILELESKPFDELKFDVMQDVRQAQQAFARKVQQYKFDFHRAKERYQALHHAENAEVIERILEEKQHDNLDDKIRTMALELDIVETGAIEDNIRLIETKIAEFEAEIKRKYLNVNHRIKTDKSLFAECLSIPLMEFMQAIAETALQGVTKPAVRTEKLKKLHEEFFHVFAGNKVCAVEVALDHMLQINDRDRYLEKINSILLDQKYKKFSADLYKKFTGFFNSAPAIFRFVEGKLVYSLDDIHQQAMLGYAAGVKAQAEALVLFILELEPARDVFEVYLFNIEMFEQIFSDKMEINKNIQSVCNFFANHVQKVRDSGAALYRHASCLEKEYKSAKDFFQQREPRRNQACLIEDKGEGAVLAEEIMKVKKHADLIRRTADRVTEEVNKLNNSRTSESELQLAKTHNLLPKKDRIDAEEMQLRSAVKAMEDTALGLVKRKHVILSRQNELYAMVRNIVLGAEQRIYWNRQTGGHGRPRRVKKLILFIEAEDVRDQDRTAEAVELGLQDKLVALGELASTLPKKWLFPGRKRTADTNGFLASVKKLATLDLLNAEKMVALWEEFRVFHEDQARALNANITMPAQISNNLKKT